MFRLHAAETPAQTGPDFEGFILEKITILSNVHFTERRLKTMLGLKTGEPINKKIIRRAFRDLYDLGILKDMKFYINIPKPGYVELFVQIDELAKISKISFVGNQKFNSDEFTTDLPLKTGDYFSEPAINKAILFLKDKYRDEGYLAAKITYLTRENNFNKEIEITFDIDEGAEIVVGTISFAGNENIQERFLKREMETKEDKWFREGKFDDSAIEEDKEKIIYYYKKKGYINAKISKTATEYRWKNPRKKTAREAHLTFWITEGEKYYFGTISVKGSVLFSEAEMYKKFRRKEGQVFNQEIHDQDIQAITSMYHNRGYIFARVTPVETIDKEKKSISYVFDIYEGDKAHIEKIFVTGNDKTKSYVIKREILIREGEIFNADKIRTSQENLMRLNYFKSAVPDFKQGSVEGLMNLTFKVDEQQTGMVQAGAGYGTKSKWSLNFDLRENNLLGMGLSTGLKLNIGQLEKSAAIDFNEPYLFKTPISFGSRISYAQEIKPNLNLKTYQTVIPDGTATVEQHKIIYVNEQTNVITTNALEYTYHKIAFSIFLGYRFLNFWRVSTENTYSLEKDTYSTYEGFGDRFRKTSQYDIYYANREKVTPFKNEFLRVYMTGVTFTRDSRNNILNPSKGSLFQYNSDFYLTGYKLTKHRVGLSFFHRLFWRFISAYKLDVQTHGRLFEEYEYDSKLEYFFYREELRGWDYADVGKFHRQQGYEYITGKARALASYEIRLPIIEYLSLAAFADIGSLSRSMISDDLNSFHFITRNQNYMMATGLGIMVNIPMFPIRLYFSYKFRYNSKTGKIEFPYEHDETLGKSKIPKPAFIFTIAGMF